MLNKLKLFLIEITMSDKFIRITLLNYNALTRTIDHLKSRIECLNRKPSDREKIAISVLQQEKIEIESVLKLYNI